MIIKKLDEKIFYYENIISDPSGFVEKIEDLDLKNNNEINISKWKTWKASNSEDIYGLSKDGVFSNVQYYSAEDIETSIISLTIKNISDMVFANYKLNTDCKNLKLPNYFSIKKYNQSVDMGSHVDAEDPTDINHPVVSGVIYLNDSYEGGEIYFPEQNIKIKPSAGSVIMFPSYRPYVHHPMKIISGNKYMIPLFWYSEDTKW